MPSQEAEAGLSRKGRVGRGGEHRRPKGLDSPRLSSVDGGTHPSLWTLS